MLVFEIEGSNYEAQLSNKEINILKKCNCLPSCANLQFSAETSEAEMHLQKTVQQSGILDYSEEYNEPIFQLFFKH